MAAPFRSFRRLYRLAAATTPSEFTISPRRSLGRKDLGDQRRERPERPAQSNLAGQAAELSDQKDVPPHHPRRQCSQGRRLRPPDQNRSQRNVIGGQGYMHHCHMIWTPGTYSQLTAERSVTKTRVQADRSTASGSRSQGGRTKRSTVLSMPTARFAGLIHMGLKPEYARGRGRRGRGPSSAAGECARLRDALSQRPRACPPGRTSPQTAKERQQAASSRLAARLSRMK